jgi:hypothetical protein
MSTPTTAAFLIGQTLVFANGDRSKVTELVPQPGRSPLALLEPIGRKANTSFDTVRTVAEIIGRVSSGDWKLMHAA